MDLTKEYSPHSITFHPAYLWVGPQETVIEHTLSFLQKQFCKSEGCTVCLICRQIADQQYHATLWLSPEKNYALDDLEVIFKTASFALEEGQHFYFIIQKADYLTHLCFNSLLKSLEEPPPGYHFILLTQRLEAILPTIQSRCIIETFQSASSPAPHSFFASLSASAYDPLLFLQELEKNAPTERESVELIDQLLTHWIQQYKKGIEEKNDLLMRRSLDIIGHLKKALLKPPMPGSSKLFWKNFFLQSSF